MKRAIQSNGPWLRRLFLAFFVTIQPLIGSDRKCLNEIAPEERRSLIGMAQQGDLNALERVWFGVGGVVRGFAKKFAGNHISTDDLAQDFFLRFGRGLRGYDTNSGYELSTFIKIHLKSRMKRTARKARVVSFPHVQSARLNQLGHIKRKLMLHTKPNGEVDWERVKKAVVRENIDLDAVKLNLGNIPTALISERDLIPFLKIKLRERENLLKAFDFKDGVDIESTFLTNLDQVSSLEMLEQVEELHFLRRCLGLLSQEDQAMLRKRFWQEPSVPYKDLAKQMGIPYDVMKRKLSSAYRFLEKCINEPLTFGGLEK